MSTGGTFKLAPIIMTFIIGVVVGYILKIIYPKNIINRGTNNERK